MSRETGYNLYLKIDGATDVISWVGIADRVIEVEEDDDVKIAILESFCKQDLVRAQWFKLPEGFQLVDASGKVFKRRIRYQSLQELCHLNPRMYMQAFEGAFQGLGVKDPSPLIVVTPVVDGRIKIDASERLPS